MDLGFFAPILSLMRSAQRRLAALILAISMYKFMPIPQKKERRGANESISMPALTPVERWGKGRGDENLMYGVGR